MKNRTLILLISSLFVLSTSLNAQVIDLTGTTWRHGDPDNYNYIMFKGDHKLYMGYLYSSVKNQYDAGLFHNGI